MARLQWRIPEGLRVLPDGTWYVGELPVAHPASLLYFKAHLVFDEEVAYVDDGKRRVPVRIEGPPLRVLSLRVDPLRGTVEAFLDDGSVETVKAGSLAMDEATGRFEFLARSGRVRALLSRSAHQALLEHADEEGGEFFLRVGPQRIAIRT